MFVSERTNLEVLVSILPVDQGLVGFGCLNFEGFVLVLADFKCEDSDDRVLSVVTAGDNVGLTWVGWVGLNRHWAEIGSNWDTHSGTVYCDGLCSCEV